MCREPPPVGWVFYVLKVGACNLYVSGSACKFLFCEFLFYFFLQFLSFYTFLMFLCLQINVANAVNVISSWNPPLWPESFLTGWINGGETLLWICSFCFLPRMRWKESMQLSVHVRTSTVLTTAPLAHVYNYAVAKELAVMNGNRWCKETLTLARWDWSGLIS